LPVGGYVKPHGFEGPEDASAEQKAAWIKGRTFHDKTVGRRALVIAAGPVFNFVLAAVLFAVVFGVRGMPGDVMAAPPTVAQVEADSPASRAGFQDGDVIRAVDGVRITSFGNLKRLIGASAGRELHITVVRGGAEKELDAVIGTAAGPGGANGRLGIVPAAPPMHRVSPAEAIAGAVEGTWAVMVGWVSGICQILTGQVAASQIGGTLRIAQMSGQFASAGTISLLTFMAVLSVNLGMVNLLPVPILDGGRLLFYAIEALRGRPVSRAVQEAGFRMGVALIAGLFLFATVNDLTQFGLFGWLRHAVVG
ncbi:MAG: RIP metalloprotease RseP, partial [Gluconacetobacter diazotrophicus]|nr:RIP metalloprotease RseP [Gluconacetobacter diazotrophicus]